MSNVSIVQKGSSPEQLATAARIAARISDTNAITGTLRGIDRRGELFAQLQGLMTLGRTANPKAFDPETYVKDIMHQLDALYYASAGTHAPMDDSHPLASILPLYKEYLSHIAAQPKMTLVHDSDLHRKAAALKSQFPHIRHDADFFDAAIKQLETTHATLKDVSWELCADDVKRQVTHFAENPQKDAGNYKTLVALLPAYQKMATQAQKDYSKGLGRQWLRKPESYAEMVAAERNTKVRDSYAFNI
jgi:hypothetical protein